jgi:hypothetical protein
MSEMTPQDVMNEFKISKLIPNVLDFLLLGFVVLSIYFKEHAIISGILLGIGCLAMVVMIVRQVKDCIQQKSLYNFTMIFRAANMKLDMWTDLVRDVIIYGLHFYLFSINQNIFYFGCLALCVFFDALIYNGAFNPFMRKYIVRKAFEITENAQKEQEK